MPASTGTSQGREADPLILRWSEGPTKETREESVKILELGQSESTILSSWRVHEQTFVYLIGKDYTGNGIIQCCQECGNDYILTILMKTVHNSYEGEVFRDPGLLAIDDFLTEEEEIKILESLSGS